MMGNIDLFSCLFLAGKSGLDVGQSYTNKEQTARNEHANVSHPLSLDGRLRSCSSCQLTNKAECLLTLF